jgi:hypothetical protein
VVNPILEEQARKVLHALEARPSLFFEVLRIAHDEFPIAAPWAESTERWERCNLTGEFLGEVFQNNVGTYTWRVGKESGQDADPVCARNIVDNLLVNQGYLLA